MMATIKGLAARPVVRLLGTLLLLGLLSIQIDLGDLVATFRDISLGYVALTIALGVGMMVFNAFRWLCLLPRAAGIRLTQVVRLTFVSAYVGLFLPGTVGSEAIKVGGLARKTGLSIAATSVLADRLLSLFTQLAIAMVLMIAFPNPFPPAITVGAFAGLICLGLFAALSFHRGLRRRVVGFLDRRGSDQIAARITTVTRAIDHYRSPVVMVTGLVLAALLQVFRAVFLWACSKALGGDIGLPLFLIALPVVSVVEMLPISIAGIGPREAAFVFVLAQFGIPSELTIATSLLAFFAGTVIAAFLGFLLVSVFGVARDVIRRAENRQDAA